jgi:hypothetical protein
MPEMGMGAETGELSGRRGNRLAMGRFHPEEPPAPAAALLPIAGPQKC